MQKKEKIKKEENKSLEELTSSDLETLLELLHRHQEKLYHELRDDLDWCWTITILLELQEKLERMICEAVKKEEWWKK